MSLSSIRNNVLAGLTSSFALVPECIAFALVAQVKALNGPVLVVGHSNTLSELVRLFGGQPGAEIADNEYDRVYQLTPGTNGSMGTVVFTSLPETDAAP
ncbi:hypothetical protein [Pseudomonas sp.]|uniref:hypothetical protein n=1 Tax=Pseudomonas sp. TaxID=306 RepID=UPI002583384F|nr:hypothetical protein [Pseudomonas sp.]